MKLKNKVFPVLCFLLIAAVFVSCSQEDAGPPYVITQSSVTVGAGSSMYRFAGAHFTVANAGNKTIHSLTVCFLLFDADGDICLPLGNMIESTCLKKIKPFQSQEIVVNLDSVLGSQIRAPYQLGNMFVKQIVFSDGTVWTDPLGLYAV